MLNVFSYVSIFLGLAASASVTSGSQGTASQATTSTAVCPSRTANIITHNLPQQCLTSTRRNTDVPPQNATLDESSLNAAPSFVSNATDAAVYNTSESTVTAADSVAVSSTIQTSSSDADSDSTSQTPVSSTSAPTDDPSPLDDGQFMSFEDWKKQNLQKAGQSEHVGRESSGDRIAQRKQTSNIHTALDTLGDDTEIELDFAGFMPGAPGIVSPSRNAPSESPETMAEAALSSPPKIKSGSKDAGTTCKERFNYASFDCAANVLKSNQEATSSSAVLGENKDSYMLNVCSAENKFLILELCDDISIDTIVLANYEFFSSIFRTFRVSVSDKYPVKSDKWKSLGVFEARNTREVQAFLVENPVIWARYVRIEFLTHYGKEYYCPVSLVRVHGTTMLEEYKHDLESAQAENDDVSDVVDLTLPPEDALVPEAVAEDILSRAESRDNTRDTTDAVRDASAISTSGQKTEETSLGKFDAIEGSSTGQIQAATEPASQEASMTATNASSTMIGTSSVDDTLSNHSNRTSTTSSVTAPSSGNATTAVHASSHISSSSSETATPMTHMVSQDASQAVSKVSSAMNGTSSERSKSSGSATQSAPAMPTMQESFFKSVQKRLQMLESNSSLSLQYIEDQSRALRDAFNKVEQRQLTKTTSFLDHLNSTVLSELREFRQQYDQLWQSTVIELEMQRERYHQETEAMNARLGILADELIFQKRISILQMMLVLVCLALVLFTKGAFDQYLELPLVQSVLARSPSSRWLNTSSLETPTQSPPTTRQSSLRKRHGILKGHRRVQSEDSVEGSLSPNDMYTPPTPVSMTYAEPSDGEQVREPAAAMDDPEFDPSTIERPSTSPPELSGTLPPSPERSDVDMNESIEARLLRRTSQEASPSALPRVVVEQATPPPKQLSWRLPE
jgi:hypothetical protein